MLFSQWFVCRLSRIVGLLKRRMRSQVVKGIKNCKSLREKHILKWNVKKLRSSVLGALFAVLTSKTCTSLRREALFWSSDVEKMHAAVAKNRFGSENVQNMSSSLEHFLTFWCRNIARRCSAKHICKWNVQRREAHLQVKMYRTLCFSTLFELQMSKNLSVSKFFSQ